MTSVTIDESAVFVPVAANPSISQKSVALSLDIISKIKQIETGGKSREQKIASLKYMLNEHLRNTDFDKNMFFCVATRLFRMGESTSLCAICLQQKINQRLKENASEHPMCHIFPRTLLDAYKKVHCPPDQDEFIYNSYSEDDDKFVSSKKLAFPLFCQACDNSASEEENCLKIKYIQIVGTDERLIVTREDGEKLKHILALIMFRGALLGVDFPEENDRQFYEIFEKLRQYVSHFSKDYREYQKDPISEHFHVFILPNFCFNSGNPLAAFIIDLQLRNPQFTTVVKAGDGSKYLYMKFDIFHCLLAIEVSHPNLLQLSCFHANGTFYSIPIGNEGIQLLPEFLMTYNMNRMKVLTWQLRMLKKSCNLYIQDPTQSFATFEIPKLPFAETEPVNVNALPKDNIKNEKDAKLALARTFSPITLEAVQNLESFKLNHKCQKLEEDKKNIQKKLDKEKGSLKQLRTDCARKHSQWYKLQADLDALTSKYDYLKQEKDELEAKYHYLVQKTDELEAMVNNMEGNNRLLQQELDQRDQKIRKLERQIKELETSNILWQSEDTFIDDTIEQNQTDHNFDAM